MRCSFSVDCPSVKGGWCTAMMTAPANLSVLTRLRAAVRKAICLLSSTVVFWPVCPASPEMTPGSSSTLL